MIIIINSIIWFFHTAIVLHDAFPNPFKKYDETTLQLCITRPPSGVRHAAKISRKKSNSKFFDFKRNPEIGCESKFLAIAIWAWNT